MNGSLEHSLIRLYSLPFMMPMGQYNIGKYVNSLLVSIGFVVKKV